MTDAYMRGKDLYATIASGVYKNDYWDNMEHYQDGSPNPEGKKRRSNCKSLLLGKRNVMPPYIVIYKDNDVNLNDKRV